MEYYSATKNNEIMPFAATWVDLKIIILSKSEREGQISYEITHIWNLKRWSWGSLQSRNRLIDIEAKLMVTKLEEPIKSCLGLTDTCVHTQSLNHLWLFEAHEL